MARVVSPEISRYFRARHEGRACGPARYGRRGARRRGTGRSPRSWHADGRRLPADLVVVGIGVVPEHGARRSSRPGRRRRHRRGRAPADQRSRDLRDRRLRRYPSVSRRPPRPARVRSERGRPGTLRRRPDRRRAGALCERAVVLERPARMQAADRGPHRRPRAGGAARRRRSGRVLGVLLPGRPADRCRVRQPAGRPHGGAEAARRRSGGSRPSRPPTRSFDLKAHTQQRAVRATRGHERRAAPAAARAG